MQSTKEREEKKANREVELLLRAPTAKVCYWKFPPLSCVAFNFSYVLSPINSSNSPINHFNFPINHFHSPIYHFHSYKSLSLSRLPL